MNPMINSEFDLSVLPSLLFPGDNSWRADAFCLNKGIDFFDGKRTRRALACCAKCPVVAPCLKFALDNELQGVYGGTTETQRQKMRT